MNTNRISLVILTLVVIAATAVMAATQNTMVLIVVITLMFTITAFAPRDVASGTAVGNSVALATIASTTSAPTVVWQLAQVCIIVLLVIGTIRTMNAAFDYKPAQPLRPWFLAWVCMTVAVTATTDFSSVGLSTIVTISIIMVLCVFTRPLDANNWRVLSYTVIVSALSQLPVVIYEILPGSQPIWGFRNTLADGSAVIRLNPFLGEDLVRAQGTTGHPIVLACLVGAAIILCLDRRWSSPLAVQLLVVFVLAGIFLLTGTRSALFALTLALVYKILHMRGKKRAAWAGAAIVCAFWLLVVDSRISTVASELFMSSSFQHRFSLVELIPELFDRDPISVAFGEGLGFEYRLFGAGYLQQDGFEVIDNQFVSLFIATGLIGLAVFVIGIVLAFMGSTATQRALMILFVVMFFSFDLIKWPVTWTIFVGILAGARNMASSKSIRSAVLLAPAVPTNGSFDRHLSHAQRRSGLV